MKTVLKVLSVFISVIILILALAFIIIEGRLLFSGDWIIYDSPLMGFIRYLFRLTISVFAFIKSLFGIVFLNNESKNEQMLFGDIMLMISAVVLLIFTTNYVGVVCISLATLNLLKGIVNNKIKI